MLTIKICKTCNNNFPLTSFYKHTGSKDGLRGSCKSCVIQRQKETLNPEKAKATKKRYYEKNRQEVINRSAKFREENREFYLNDQIKRSIARRKANPELAKKRARTYSLKSKYGITLEQYDALLEKQKGCCAICDRPATDFSTSLAVDHNHKTLEIRGLLCTHCNHRLVGRHTDGTILRRIAEYVDQGTGWFTPEPKKKKRKSTSNRKS